MIESLVGQRPLGERVLQKLQTLMVSDKVTPFLATPHYIKWSGHNFGDLLNDVLFQDVIGIQSKMCLDTPVKHGIFVSGIGSIFHSAMDITARSKGYVFGSGVGYNPQAPEGNFDILFLRGPLSCRHLGIEEHYALADAAYALSHYVQENTSPFKDKKLGIIPHHWSLENKPQDWARMNDEDVLMIDPHLDCASFIRELSRCEKIVTECLHGAIVADMLRIPFAITQTTPMFHSFKWLDWLESVGLKLDIRHIDMTNAQAALASCEGFAFQLTQQKRLEQIYSAMDCEIERLKFKLEKH